MSETAAATHEAWCAWEDAAILCPLHAAAPALLAAARRPLEVAPEHGPMCGDGPGECICWMGELRAALKAAARA